MNSTALKHVARIGLTAALLLSAVNSAQAFLTEDEVMAGYLLKLSRLLHWDTVTDGSREFEFCVLGKHPVAYLLVANAEGRSVNDRPIVVKAFASASESGWQGCDILFVTPAASDQSSTVVSGVQDKTVTVGFSPGFASRGGAVNFVRSGGKLKLEVNRMLLRAKGITAEERLLSVVSVVK